MKSIISICIGFGIGIGIGITSAHARILNVPDEFETIQAGIRDSDPGDTVLLDTGIYRENIDFLGKSILVAGNYIFDGNYHTRRNTIIDGGDGGPAVSFVSAEDSNACIAGIKITGSSGRRTFDELDRECFAGAGIFCYRSDPIIRSCEIREARELRDPENNRYNRSRGGGAWFDSSEATLVNCDFILNEAVKGGGIFGIGSELRIINCLFEGNSTQYGGAIELQACTLVMLNCRFEGNREYSVKLTAVSGQIDSCRFRSAPRPFLIQACNNLVVENTSFAGNGEIISFLLSVSSPAVFRYCSFWVDGASGVCIEASGGARFEFCNIVNTAPVNDELVAIYSSGSAQFHNCTIKGGIVAYNSALVLYNSIVTMMENQEWEIFFSPDYQRNALIVDHSLIQGGLEEIETNYNCDVEWREGSLDGDPLFIGGQFGDRLSPDSPCIDAGDPDSPLDPDGTRADMGAFYFHQRDIEVYPRNLRFEALPFGVVDSQLVIAANIGGTPLTFQITESQAGSSITISEADGQDIVVQPNSGRALWAYYRPVEGAPSNQTFTITSDDPDEPVITIEATEVLSVSDPQFSPLTFHLSQPYPNPFNSTTTIRFSLESVESVKSADRLAIYDLSGRLVHEFDTQALSHSGTHSLVWNAASLPAGVYLIRLESGPNLKIAKAVLIR